MDMKNLRQTNVGKYNKRTDKHAYKQKIEIEN